MSLTVPNIISLLRIIIAPVYLLLIISGNPEYVRLAVFLFIMGAFSDYVDGWIARKFGVTTRLGKFVDPLADKILTLAAFISFVRLEIIPLWMVLVIIFRDFGTTILRVYADSRQFNIKTLFSAKAKTFLQMLFIILILIFLYLKNSDLAHIDAKLMDSVIYSEYVWGAMFFITIVTIATAIEYLIRNRKLFSSKAGRNGKTNI